MLQFPETHVALLPGDSLWFFTDGIFEARAGQGLGMFGIERIRALMQECGNEQSLGECTDAAKLAVERFTRSSELQDDLTLLALRRKTPV
jgi:serine phosphatase RsbU (regulator of sigma subunit)